MDSKDEFEIWVSILGKTVDPLLAWYDQNARILPWRENTDPYRIWVSEIMLQQTRVEAVKPYYEHFLKQLPTISDLAGAKEESLLKLWEGLGYYSRVKNMRKAAKIICDEYGGIFPRDFEAVLRLPGIGPYTAGAICSIAFSQPVPAVDGNVLRVTARLTECGREITEPVLKKQVTTALKTVYPLSRCGDYTQSLMELGAIVCTPGGVPKCEVCPLNFLCKSYATGTQMSYPVASEKKPRKKLEKTVFLLQSGEQIAIRKRQPDGLLGGMWELPNTNGALSADESKIWLEAQGITAQNIFEMPKKKHIFTHVEWQMQCYSVTCNKSGDAFVWVDGKQLKKEIALPTAFKKILDF